MVTVEDGVTVEPPAAEDMTVPSEGAVKAGVVTATGSVALVRAVAWATTAASLRGVAAEVVTAGTARLDRARVWL